MTVRVQAGFWARRYKTDALVSGDNLTALEAVKLVGIPENEIGLLVIDGKAVPPNTLLQDGDELWCHPFIIGG